MLKEQVKRNYSLIINVIKVDGYYYDRENKMRNVYEFFGCYWHGCTKCYSPEEICKKDRNKKTMKELYDQTKERLKTIEDYLKPNVKIHTIWEYTFMKYKQEASGCKCDPKYCKPDCENDKECKTKIQYIIDNAAYNLDIDKVKHNSGLRFIAKICLNNLWGHFAHARLKLYELLDILQERVLYMDTDSCIYNDDGSEACKKVENMMEVN
ncbi:unnamed protein product [Mytilus coruscus]|uniref:DNA-directed DNA polymerase n=1 Tax=Mytilus coruscus TaxID=42192 RepID=A0A6J8BXY3_MYTCO|nr:unnamed protein product [Mytilus coruscus]